ncbi:MAG TPA: dihydrofolate reductase family protein [Kofleriaceae bacterium]|jgi:dihydrofolate reductase
MRRLIYGINTSLDLYVEDADGKFDWGRADETMLRHWNARTAYATTELYGRRMWETMSSYWPAALNDASLPPVMREFARLWNAGEHIVFSRTLTSVGHGARLVTGDAIAEVKRLKAGDGPDIDVSGPGLANALLEAGLVDEVHACINPIVLGGGKRMISARIELELIGTQTFDDGVVQLRYRTKHTSPSS